jgi:hypothetical protein
MRIEITEPTQYIKRDYDYAAWWKEYELQPGIYEVTNPGPLPYFRRIVGIKAIVIKDNFRSHLWGHYGEYDENKNAGKEEIISIGFVDQTRNPEYQLDLELTFLKYHPTFRILER